MTDPSTSTIRRGFRKVDVMAQLQLLTAALDAALSGDPEISDVVWLDV
ncbi:MAG: hypothetical protein WCF36_01420 [Candidatus Nanopelagicales bacterium]